MKLLTYTTPEGLRLGLRTDSGLLDVARASAALGLPAPDSMLGAMAPGALDQLARLAEVAAGRPELLLAEESLTFAPCVPNPTKIVGIGLNYRRHAEESGMPIPETPVLFSKYNLTLAGHMAEVTLPKLSNQVDYEGELVIIMGRHAEEVPADAALTYVFGYTVGIDHTARDLQNRTSQWLLGKSCPGFNPIGPYVVTADEVSDPNNLRLRTWINGELRQDSTTSDMIFSCAELISYVSHYMPLEPGDVIMTGTPFGVALGYPPDVRQQYFLKVGDVVEVEVERLGRLRVAMRAPAR